VKEERRRGAGEEIGRQKSRTSNVRRCRQATNLSVTSVCCILLKRSTGISHIRLHCLQDAVDNFVCGCPTNRVFFNSPFPPMRVLGLMTTVIMLRSGLCCANVGQNSCAFVSLGVCLHNSFQLCFRWPKSKFAKTFEQKSGTRFMASSSGGRGAKGITIDRMLQQQVCARIICILVVLVIMLLICVV
jgi:hypothetical protein